MTARTPQSNSERDSLTDTGDNSNHTSREASDLWRPLRTPVFRNLLIASFASDIGAFTQNVGAAWVMVSLHAGPLFIALTQTASALPFFVLALPAGVIGDIVNRRKLILFAEIWMAAVAVVLAAITIVGWLTPVLLLVLTFALSAGDALESPAWRASLPELVSKEDLPSATSLNGIEFNLARAVGPALGGVLIALVGIASTFVLNAISFVSVIYAITRWKSHSRKHTTPPETLGSATRAAFRYVRYSPGLNVVLIRSGIVMFVASALLALLPSIAHDARNTSLSYGFLLGCFGFGAVAGALAIQSLRNRWSTEQAVSGAVLVFGLSSLASGILDGLPALGLSLILGGAAWIVFVSYFNVIILKHTPEWVRSRVLAVSMLVFQGAMAAGSALWGGVATRVGSHAALIWAGLGALIVTPLGLIFKLPDTPVDITPWIHWRLPSVVSPDSSPDDAGPVLVTVEYEVEPGRESEFLQGIHRYQRIRRRDGAYRWGVFRDLERPNSYVETFLVASWGEHLRQHARMTRADQMVVERLHSNIRGTPIVRHLIYEETKT